MVLMLKIDTRVIIEVTTNKGVFTMKIKDARLNAGLTQQAMSDLLEIPLRTIENWEGGKSKPPIYVEKLIIEKLDNIANERFNMKKIRTQKRIL